MAQAVTLTVYLFYSIYFYCYAGQFSLPLSYQGMKGGPARDFCNVGNIIGSVVSCAIYAQVGIKGSYVGIVEELFKGPKLTSRLGMYIHLLSPYY